MIVTSNLCLLWLKAMCKHPLKSLFLLLQHVFLAKNKSASLPVLTRLASSNYGAVLVGSVKTSLTEKLQAAVKTVQNVKLTFATKEADKDYALFVIAPTSWMLRETVATKLSGTTGYCLSIEASVN